MKLFQSAENNLKIFGISRDQHWLNGKLLMAFTTYWVGIILNCVLIVREVQTFSEILNLIFMMSETIAIATSFTIFIILKNKLFHFANGAEDIADRGKIYALKLI